MKNIKLSISQIAGIIVLSGTSSLGFSQSDQQMRGGLEEIVVTARKREESLQDAPVTVSVYSKDYIDKFDLTSLERIAETTPQFYVGRASNGSGAQISMRGIGSSSTSIGVEQSVAVIVDNVYFGQGRVLNEAMFDMQQIELLKGPQALFFGKNATAGVVSLTTAKPTEEFEAMARAGYELEADEQRYEGFISGPLTDTIGARLALKYSEASDSLFKDISTPQPWGVIDTGTGETFSLTAPVNNNDLPGNQELLARFMLSFDPTEDLSGTLSYTYTDSELENSSFNYTHFNCPDGVAQGVPRLRCGDNFNVSQNLFPQEIAASLPYAASDGSLYNDYESWSVTANLEYTLGAFTLTSTTNIQENENAFACACDYKAWPNAVFATEFSKWEAWSEEVRLTSDFNGIFNFMAGFLYQETKREFQQWFAFGGLKDTVNITQPWQVYTANSKDSSTDGETFSPFFQFMLQPREDIEITVGARYTEEEKDSSFVHPYMNVALRGLWRNQEPLSAQQKFDEWSPEATIRWDVTEETSVYLAYKTGYKSGGFSNSGLFSSEALGGSVNDFLFEPETAKGYEFGVKSTLLDNQMRLSFTAYSYDYEDLQVDFFNAPVFQFITLNAGESTTEGFEAEGEFAPHALPGLSLRGSIAYNKSEYEDFISPCWAGQTAAQGCNLVVEGTGAAGQDISGEPTAMAPEWSACLGISYQYEFGNGMSAGITLDAMYSDDYNASGFANPHAMRDSYTTLNGNVFVAGSEDRWELMLIGKNLTDEHIISGVIDGPSTGSAGVFADQIGFTANPRTLAMQLTVRFH